MSHFAFVILQQIKEVTTNRHDKLNRCLTAQTRHCLMPKIVKIGW